MSLWNKLDKEDTLIILKYQSSRSSSLLLCVYLQNKLNTVILIFLQKSIVSTWMYYDYKMLNEVD